jgi:ABC-type nickel/cobalt efflux system permease component RcnA
MLVITLLLLVILGWFLYRRWKNRAQQGHHKPKHHHVQHPYHSVSVETLPDCCIAAHNLTKKRYLSDEAPMLPLENCQARDCQCRYQHFDDRRDEEESRRNDFGLSKDLFGQDGQANRREQSAGRRTSDKRIR